MYAAIAVTGTFILAFAAFMLTSLAFELGGPPLAILTGFINLFFGIWAVSALWEWCAEHDLRP